MTDISNWWRAVHVMKIPNENAWDGKEEDYLVARIMVPLNEYQMGNLIDAIAQVSDTGDWYHEFISIVLRAMKVAGIKELRSNNGRVFTYEQLQSGNVRAAPQSA